MKFCYLNSSSKSVQHIYSKFKAEYLYKSDLQGKDLAYFELKYLAQMVITNKYGDEEPLNTQNNEIKSKFENISPSGADRVRKEIAYKLLSDNIEFYADFSLREKERRQLILCGYTPIRQLDGIYFSLDDKYKKINHLKEKYQCLLQ